MRRRPHASWVLGTVGKDGEQSFSRCGCYWLWWQGITMVICIEERLRHYKSRNERKLRDSRNLAPWRKGKVDILKHHVGRDGIFKSFEQQRLSKTYQLNKALRKSILSLVFLFKLDKLKVPAFTLKEAREGCEKALWDLSIMTKKEPWLWLRHGTESR